MDNRAGTINHCQDLSFKVDLMINDLNRILSALCIFKSDAIK